MSTGFEAYRHLRDYESTFEQSMRQLRQTAAVWIFASIGALAYVLVPELAAASDQPADPDALKYAAVIVCWLSLLGLFLIWWLDERVYLSMLHSVFIHGLWMEWSDPDLPRIRTAIFAQTQSIHWKTSLFYYIPAVLYLLVGAWAYLQLPSEPPALLIAQILAVPSVTIALLFSVIAMIVFPVRELRHQHRLIDSFGAKYGEAFTNFYRDLETVKGYAAGRIESTAAATTPAPKS